MPTAALRPCIGCHKNLVPKGRCHECAPKHEQERRPAHITKFYNSKAWQNARNMKRRQDPLCEDCLKPGPTGMRTVMVVQVVDHVLPLATHWEMRLVLENLRSLCHPHHDAKTKGRR